MTPFIIDQYTERRGAPSMLKLHCTNCKTLVLLYQKDGPGPLLRCYLDRIHGPKHLVHLQNPPKELICPACSTQLGKLGIYEKENRLAFFLEENSFAYSSTPEKIN